METPSTYTPPKIWQWETKDGGTWASINRPIAGPTHDKALPIGQHPLQLYSLATPNGQKVTIMLEELLALGITAAEYDAYPIKINQGDQFGSGFVGVNPNSKIPALVDRSTTPPTRVFESGSILLYLAEKFNALLPTEPAQRTECLSWLFWQMGSAPYVGGGFGHFYSLCTHQNSNIRSIASPWRPNARWMCSIDSWPTSHTSAVMLIRSLTLRSGLGMGDWY